MKSMFMKVHNENTMIGVFILQFVVLITESEIRRRMRDTVSDR